MLGIKESLNDLKPGVTEGYEGHLMFMDKSVKELEVYVNRLTTVVGKHVDEHNIDIGKLSSSELENTMVKFYNSDKGGYATIRKVYDDLGNTLTERFGFKVIVDNTSDYSVGIDSIRPILDTDFVKLATTKIDKELPVNKILKLKDEKRRKVLLSVFEDLGKSLNTKGIKLDNKNLTVKGLNKSVIYIKINPIKLLSAKLTVKEITSMLLGQCLLYFNEISLIGQTYNRSSDVMKTLNNSLGKYGDVSKATVLVSGEIDAEVKEDGSTIKQIGSLTDGLMSSLEKEIESYKSSNIALSEKLSRFGLGVEYTQALFKLTETNALPKEYYGNTQVTKFLEMVMSLVILVITLVLVLFSIFGIAVYFVYKTVSGLTSYLMRGVIRTFSGFNGVNDIDAIDVYLSSLKNNKSNYIRMLRELDISMDERSHILGQIKDIELVMETYSKFVNYYKKTLVDLKDKLEVTDSVINNDLHAIYHKLKI